MKLHIIETEDKDGLLREAMTIDNKKEIHVFPLCESPEDAIIGRCLISCSEIAEYMKLAFEAGKRGEEFEIELEKGITD